jgi:hypothetical protein
MIAHVAEAGEGSGRVVLQLGPQLSGIALDAALQLARSFRSEVEAVYTDDGMLIDLAAYPFAREISIAGAIKGPIDTVDLQRRQHRTAAATIRRVATAAREAGIRFTSSVHRQDATTALAGACAERGPWNMVALGEPVASHDRVKLREMFSTVWGTTGFVLAGPKARRTTGPVVAVVEDIERFSPLLRTAEHLAAATASATEVLLVGHDPHHVVEMELQARLILNDEAHINMPITTVSHGGAPAIGAALRALGAGFVIAHYDGIAMPSEGEDTLLAENLEGPLLLVR